MANKLKNQNKSGVSRDFKSVAWGRILPIFVLQWKYCAVGHICPAYANPRTFGSYRGDRGQSQIVLLCIPARRRRPSRSLCSVSRSWSLSRRPSILRLAFPCLPACQYKQAVHSQAGRTRNISKLASAYGIPGSLPVRFPLAVVLAPTDRQLSGTM